MAAPGGFEYWRRGQAPVALAGASSSGTLEHWRRGGALRVLASVAAAAVGRVYAYFVG
jgi:hypothetical protein